MLRKTLFFSTAILLIASIPLAAQSVDDIIAKNIESRGGLDKIKAVKSYKMIGTMSMQGGMIQGDVVLRQKRDNKVHVEFNMQGMTVVQAYDGETPWQILPPMAGGSGAPEVMSGDQAKQTVEMSDMDGFLIDYKRKGHQVELIGKEDMDGTEVYRLDVTLDNGQAIQVFIDTENYIELKHSATRSVPGMGETELDTYLSDYKEVDGLMLPHSFEVKAGGNTLQQLTISSIETNVEIDDSLFSMAGK